MTVKAMGRIGACVMAAMVGTAARASVQTTVTTDGTALAAALAGTGLTITSVSVRNGVPGQIGTFTNYDVLPVTIRDGVVLSSGNVANLSPLAEALEPGYSPASPPERVNNVMALNGDGSTLEFNDYGSHGGTIEHFHDAYDVAAIAVTFVLPEDSHVKFDFVFGSVEFPFYTSDYTDAFLAFLDGFDRDNQVAFDAAGEPVQVGRSFAGLETSSDQNTAFSLPHAVIHHLTTTTDVLKAGEHTIVFEVGDVNDQILDSAAFITNLRAEPGEPGTGPSDDDSIDCPGDLNGDSYSDGGDLSVLLSSFGSFVLTGTSGDYNQDGRVDAADLSVLLADFGCHS